MMFKRAGRMITGLCLSAILCFGSVGESFGALPVFAAGEDSQDEDAAPEKETVSDDKADEEAVSDNTAEEEGCSGEVTEDDTVPENGTDPSVSENDTTGGGSEEQDPADQYPYQSPDDDPAYAENDVWISDINDTSFMYDGTEHKPHPFIFYDMEMLREGKDYTLSWKNTVKAYICDNKKTPSAGDFENGPQVIVTMKGNFSGSHMAFYNIMPRDISMGEFESEDVTLVYTGKKLDYTPRLIWKGKELKFKSDFEYDIYDSINDECRDITDDDLKGDPEKDVSYFIRLKGKGNFSGVKYTSLSIVHIPNAVSAKELKVASVPAQKFTGQPVNPDMLSKNGKAYELKVTYGKTLLKKGVDYDVYVSSEAIFPGKYNLEIRGKNTPGTDGIVCVGSKLVSFTIEGSLKDASVTGVKASYDTPPAAEYVRPDEELIKVSVAGTEIPSDYYSISYKKDNKAGTAQMTVKGINGFKGKKTVKYQINGRSIEGLEIVVNSAFYRKKGSIPSVTVADGTEFLINNVNFTCKYKNNKKFNDSKKPTVTIKGKGLYTGKKTVEFKIRPVEVDEEKGFSITVQDKVYSSKPGGYIPKIVIKDPDGQKLKEGVDYDVVYTNAANEVLTKDYVAKTGEELTAEIKTKGAYEEDSFFKKFHIIEKGRDINKATVKVKAQIYKYSDKGVRIPYDDETIKVTLGGQTLHRIDGDHFVNTELSGELNGFEVITSSYKDNEKCGTASVQIRGVGIYGGIKTIKYKIKAKEVDGLDPNDKFIPVPDKYRSVEEFGAIPDDNKDDTGAIMNAINAISTDDEHGHNLYFPKGRYNVCGSGNINIGVPDVNIVMDAKAELYVASQGDSYNVIIIHEDNISIRGGKISGERFRHSGGSVGQYGMGIAITDGKNISIRDMVICDNRGDGIYINDNGKGTVSNVTIKDCDIYDNARNNIGVIRCDYLTIENCHIHHEKDGHSPMAGIDLEPDMKVGQVKDNKKVKHVVIKGCKIETYQHQGARLNDMNLWAYYGIMIIYGFGEPVVEDVRIENCDIYGDLSKGSSKDLKIINTTVHGEILQGDC